MSNFGGAYVAIAVFSWAMSVEVTDAQVKKSLLLGIDGLGFGEQGYLVAQTPFLDSLSDGAWQKGYKGASSNQAFSGGGVGTSTQQATVSGPGWSTMLTGVWTDRHGVSGIGMGTFADDDVLAFVSSWLLPNTLENPNPADLNLDGIANLADWSLLSAETPSMGAAIMQSLAGTPIPEPTTWLQDHWRRVGFLESDRGDTSASQLAIRRGLCETCRLTTCADSPDDCAQFQESSKHSTFTLLTGVSSLLIFRTVGRLPLLNQ